MITIPPTSRPQSATHGHVDLPLTPVPAAPPPYAPGHLSGASLDIESGIGTKAAVECSITRSTTSPSGSNILCTVLIGFTALSFVTLICTIIIFVLSSVLTLIGAHLLSWNPAFPLITTWRHTLAAVAIGSAILGTFVALGIIILCADVLQDAPVNAFLVPCAAVSVFAFATGVAAFPKSVVPVIPFTWRNALYASGEGIVGLCFFVLVCMAALVVGSVVLLSVRQLTVQRGDDRSARSRPAVSSAV